MTSRLAPFYTTSEGNRKKVGEYIHRGDLASTLDRIAENGIDDFYTGGLADDIQKAVSYRSYNIADMSCDARKPVFGVSNQV